MFSHIRKDAFSIFQCKCLGNVGTYIWTWAATILSYLRCGRYPSFLAFELCPLLLWRTAALRVQPHIGCRRFNTSNSHHRSCLCWRAGVLGSRRGRSRERLLLWRWTWLTCHWQRGAVVPLNQLTQNQRRLRLQAKLTCRHRHTTKQPFKNRYTYK